MTVSAPYIPENAPFNPAQRSWLNGFLAGMYSSDGEHAQASAVAATPVTVAFGSQTGTAESLSKKAAKQLSVANCEVKVVDMSELTAEGLKEIQNLLIITSTYGEGDPPDNAMEFHASLMEESAPQLEGLHFSVLGLGDSSYPDFCQCSKEFDARLEALGAKRIAPMVEVDGDPDDLFPEWLKAAQSALSSDAAPVAEVQVEAEEESSYTKKNPFPAKLLTSVNLNGVQSSKATHHVELSLEGSGIEYEVGDALGVYPENDPGLVDAILAAAGLGAEESVELESGESVSNE
jgi:sulfite reductase (NADPH) flavoprotein alpha-component